MIDIQMSSVHVMLLYLVVFILLPLQGKYRLGSQILIPSFYSTRRLATFCWGHLFVYISQKLYKQ